MIPEEMRPAVRRFADAAEAGVVARTLGAVSRSSAPWAAQRSAIVPELAAVYQRVHAYTRETVARQVGSQMVAKRGPALDPVAPARLAYAQQHAGDLLTNITPSAQAAVRQTIITAVRDRLSPAQLATKLRPLISVTAPQGQAITRRVDQWLQRRFDAAMAKATRQRALTIARTELLTAANAGQQAAWMEARTAGLIPDGMVKEFITTPDDRLCPICEPLDGEQVELDAPFSFGGQYPPVHVSCRCTTGLVRSRRAAERVDSGGEARPVTINEVYARLPASDRALIEKIPVVVEPGERVAGGAFGYFDPYDQRIVVGSLSFERGGGLLAHEVGHAFDNRLIGGGGPGRWFWSDGDKAFKAAWKADWATLGQTPLGKEYKTFLTRRYTSQQRGQELFADLYATQRAGMPIRGRAFSPTDMQQLFPKASAIVQTVGP